MDKESNITRREMIARGLKAAAVGAVTAGAAGMAVSRAKGAFVWQIDPEKCVACGKCATYCVLPVSAVKCLHAHNMCGYCDFCTGYFIPDPPSLDTGAENQLCPLAAITRKFVEEPYFEYTIDKDLCNGCGKCVKGCSSFGNGSLFLQVMHDRCLNCNQCAIAVVCPSEAFVRVPADKPYLLKGREEKA